MTHKYQSTCTQEYISEFISVYVSISEVPEYTCIHCSLHPLITTSEQVIPRLHCHWKLSQNSTVLKITWCWLLTGSVYTAIIRTVILLAKETNKKAQNAWYAATQSWYRCKAFLGQKRTCSVLGTAAAQIWLDAVYTGGWGLKPCWFRASCFIKASWAGMAQLGSPWCWHALVMFTLSLLIVSGCAVTGLSYGFKLQCKRGIRHTRLMTSNAVCSCTWTITYCTIPCSVSLCVCMCSMCNGFSDQSNLFLCGLWDERTAVWHPK